MRSWLLGALLLLLPVEAARADEFLVREHAGIAYVFAQYSPEIRRFDLETGTELTSLDNGSGVSVWGSSAAVVDDDGIYAIVTNTGIVHLSLDGTEREVLTPIHVQHLESDATFLLVGAVSSVRVIRKSDGVEVDSLEVPGLSDLTPVPDENRLLVVSGEAFTPGRLGSIDYSAEGLLGPLVPSDEDRVDGPVRSWLLPDGARVVDVLGNVYSLPQLEYLESIPAGVTGIDFHGNEPIVAGDDAVTYFEAGFAPLGRVDAPGVFDVLVHGDELYVFAEDAFGNLGVSHLPLSALALPEPAPKIDPTDLGYLPGQIEIGPDGVVYLLSPLHRNVFRWSVAEGRYLESIALVEVPEQMAVAASGDALLLRYDRRLTRLDLTTLEEEPVTALPDHTCGLGVVGDFLLVNGWNGPIFTYTPAGELVASSDLDPFCGAFAWSPSRGRVLAVGTEFSTGLRSFAVSDQGELSDPRLASSIWAAARIRLAPDESLVAAGSLLYEVDSIATPPRVLKQHNPITDAAWSGSALVTIETWSELEVREWLPPYASSALYHTVGEPLRLLPLPDGLLLVHLVDGAPRFTHLAPGSGDLDSDGTADSADAFPLDPAESSDRDADGVGDHEDAFPDDPFESSDRDGDRIGDESDWLPDLPAAAMAKLVVDMRFAIRPLGRLGARSGNQLHLFADGTFALCSGPASCLAGLFAPDPRHPERLTLSMPPASLEDLAADLAAAVEPAFEDRYGALSLSLAFLPDRARLSVESKRSGKIVLSIKLPHEALIPERRPKPYPGVFRIRGTGELVEPG